MTLRLTGTESAQTPVCRRGDRCRRLSMQTLRWYKNRLAAMSGPEIVWRLGGKVRDTFDRVTWSARKAPPELRRIAHANGRPLSFEGDGRVSGGLWLEPGRSDSDYLSAWREALAAEANDLLAGRMRLFGRVVEVGRAIDWNYEYNAKRPMPRGYAADIDYRDYRETGDCKWAWEPSRHHQLVVLGRAYRVTGDRRYATAVVDLLRSWMEQCPIGVGMQWRSPLELAIRVINWVWALEMIRPSGAVDAGMGERLVGVAYRHLWDIARKYSKYSSANNHSIGEAAGVYVGAAYWPQLNDAAAWRAEAKDLLVKEMLGQVDADGVHQELAVGYHLFVTQFFTLAGLAGRRIGDEFPAEYWVRLEKMYAFVAKLCEGGDPPLMNDCDDGYVLNLGRGSGAFRHWLLAGARLFGRDEFAAIAGADAEVGETAYWLLGRDEGKRHSSAPAGSNADVASGNETIGSAAFKVAGIYLLQCGQRGGDDRISVGFDCGPLGFGSIAAHGHADALAVTLRVGGQDVLVDPGTFDYFSHPDWRDYYRSTRAHNTIEIDGQDQSTMVGLFNWSERATARCLDWRTNADGARVVGEHDGYRQMGVTHRRTVSLERAERRVVIEDELVGPAGMTFAQYWHFGENCAVRPETPHRFLVSLPKGTVRLEIDPGLTVECVRGTADSKIGWVSRAYHHRVAANALRCCGTVGGHTAPRTVIVMLDYPI